MAALPSTRWQTLRGSQLSPFPYRMQVMSARKLAVTAATALHCGLYPLIFGQTIARIKVGSKERHSNLHHMDELFFLLCAMLLLLCLLAEEDTE